MAEKSEQPQRHPNAITLQLTLKSNAVPFPGMGAIMKMVSDAVEGLGYQCQLGTSGQVMLTRRDDELVDHGGVAALIGARLLGLAEKR